MCEVFRSPGANRPTFTLTLNFNQHRGKWFSFLCLQNSFARSTKSTDFQNVTTDSCPCTIYSAVYRVCTENIVAYVFIALICLAIVDLMRAFVKYFLDRYFSSSRENNERPLLYIQSLRTDCREVIRTTDSTLSSMISLLCLIPYLGTHSLSLSHRPIKTLLFVCERT